MVQPASLHLGQEHRAPVQNRIPYRVDEKIGETDHPDGRVAEHMPTNELFKVLIAHPPQLFRLLVILTVFFHRRQAEGFGRVAQTIGDKQSAEKSQAGRNKETQPPVVQHQKAVQQHHQTGADGMRGVPDGEFAAAFVGGEPVGQRVGGRRKAHALKPAVEQPEQAERPHRIAQAEKNAHQRRRE
ncbi:MAG: hypothetical protein BWY83_02779 [bacterium ADurb.Bin478]|nr:MAG: hypothetical protein BWY83_02779 [bacterium ADurb.Bin478]